MKTTVKTSEFINALALVNGSIDKRAINPLLCYCKMEVANNCVTLTGFDFKTMTQICLSDISDSIGETAMDGAVLFPPQIALSLCQKLQTDTVTFLIEDSRLHVNRNYQIEYLPAEDYPVLPSLSGDVISLPGEDLQRHLSFANVALSSDETKQILTGINFSQEGDMIALAATDGHRLAMAEFESSSKISNVTVAGDGVRQLLKLLKKRDGDVQILLDNSHVQFACDNHTLTSRVLDGVYPNYRQLIPREFARRVVMERESVIHALDRLSVLVGSRNVVKFSLDLDTVILATEGGELGQGQEQIPAEVEGEALDVAFNVKYVLEGLKAMSTSQVQMQLNSATAPVVFSPLGEDKWLYLVMPIQLRN